MGAYGSLGKPEAAGDLAVGVPGGDQVQQFPLPGGELGAWVAALGMTSGAGSLWVLDFSGPLLRIDPASGAIIKRFPVHTGFASSAMSAPALVMDSAGRHPGRTRSGYAR